MSKPGAATTAVALTGEMSIPTVLQQIDAQIAQLKDIDQEKFKTSMNLQPFGDLKKVKDVGILIKAYSLVNSKSNAYHAAAKEMGLADYPAFKEDGNSLEAWKTDIKLQIEIDTHKEKLAELKKLREEAQQFISEDEKKEIFFAKLIGSVALGVGTTEAAAE